MLSSNNPPMPIHTRQVAPLQAVASPRNCFKSTSLCLLESLSHESLASYSSQSKPEDSKGPHSGCFLHPLATACLQQSLSVGGKEASSACSHRKGYCCKLAAAWLACKPRTTEKQQQLRYSRLSIHPSTCFSLCRLTLLINHSLFLRSIGSSKDPQTDTNLCALICILVLTHPSSVYPVFKPSHWCIDSRYTPHPTPLSTGESFLMGSWMPETASSTKPY